MVDEVDVVGELLGCKTGGKGVVGNGRRRWACAGRWASGCVGERVSG